MTVNKKILLIDDEEDFCFFLKANLEITGDFDVITTTRGKEGIQLARSAKPDLILLDIAMPEMYGDEVANKLSEDPQTNNIPIIFLTALVTEHEEGPETIKRIGERDFIGKPVAPKDLVAALQEVSRAGS